VSDLKDVLAKLKKDYGDNIGHVGSKKHEVERIPTGIFQFDLATGGGIPTGRLSIIYGAESSGKTTIAYLLAASVQKKGRKVVFVDLEGTFDADWASHCGVDCEAVIVMNPDTAERTVDVVEAMIYAEDVGLIVVDSIAAMTTENEIKSDAEKMIVGGASLIVGKMIRKAVTALSKEAKHEHYPALVCINQVRFKIGVMYGDPETMPGGQALRFASSMTVRLYGKDEMDKEVSAVMPAFKATSAIIKKFKVPVVAKNFEYKLCLVPHGTLSIGQSASWNTVANYLKQYGLLAKEKTGWNCMGVMYKTLSEIEQQYNEVHEVRLALQHEVVRREMKHVIVEKDGVDVKIDTETGEIVGE
jgi:recombination protein RecA